MTGGPESQLEPLVEVRNLKMHFPIRSGSFVRRSSGVVRAVDGIDFSLARGETLGLVGETGCGKSTAGRTVLQLYTPTEGSVRFDGVELTDLSPTEMRRMRRRMQIVFQDPHASLNPRMTVGGIVAEPLEIHNLTPKSNREERVRELLSLVGLDPDFANRYPHQFSGGQRQRIGIARALAVEPDFIVADEPVSALDVSVQAQIVNLLEELQETLGLTYLFIAHDLSVVRHVSDRIAVMYLGRIIEIGDRNSLYARPAHPYTQALLSASPVPDPAIEKTRARIVLRGDLPSPSGEQSGCSFVSRCWKSQTVCFEMTPLLEASAPGHLSACHFPDV